MLNNPDGKIVWIFETKLNYSAELDKNVSLQHVTACCLDWGRKQNASRYALPQDGSVWFDVVSMLWSLNKNQFVHYFSGFNKQRWKKQIWVLKENLKYLVKNKVSGSLLLGCLRNLFFLHFSKHLLLAAVHGRHSKKRFRANWEVSKSKIKSECSGMFPLEIKTKVVYFRSRSELSLFRWRKPQQTSIEEAESRSATDKQWRGWK